MRLLAALYLDENVDERLARQLRERGYDVLSCAEAGRKGLTDAEQIAFAVEQGRALVTHDRIDFEDLLLEYQRAGHSHCGVIIVRQRSWTETLPALLATLNRLTADELDDNVVYL